MAASGGHIQHIILRNYRLLKLAWHKSANQVLDGLYFSKAEVQPVLAKSIARQPLHPIALLRQRTSRFGGTRNFSSLRNHNLSSVSKPSGRSSQAFPASFAARALSRSTGSAPFASTLRPKLTGGAFSRFAGGYCLGSGRVGGARFFSHGPAAPREVIQNVSQAVRAFCLSGQKAQYCGVNDRGEKRFRTISALQPDISHNLEHRLRYTPSTFVEFTINPTVTALAPLSKNVNQHLFGASEPSLNSAGLLDALSLDFSRALRDLTLVLNDLSRLSELGNLSISYETPSTLRVHFPGCDAATVEALCEEVGVERGCIVQDDTFSLLSEFISDFRLPPAPDPLQADKEADVSHPKSRHEHLSWRSMLETNSMTQSAVSGIMSDISELRFPGTNHEMSLSGSHGSALDASPPQSDSHLQHDSLGGDDFEGIRKFIELCDAAKR